MIYFSVALLRKFPGASFFFNLAAKIKTFLPMSKKSFSFPLF